ncbi:deoxynucleoside monophosphate kinase [Microbacterium phage Zeta1847]|uniref:Deoxynucleoside monophosphate kinase n=1 Tax=Microbacterium phage Zeta1847 TaxID=2201444 RepID=A0A2Z4Q9A2_9CAUD|nr:deoxynucleoside monophosphate kinase [Microbacterium phage Zeta1847]AWY06657.1 deoxynucleoside monophosphate kinase [Microbacterium phage Zeta1847]
MTSTLPLIGLAGRKRHGKNRAASHLLPLGYRPVAFADPLRELVAAINPAVATVQGELVHYVETVSDLGYEAAKDEVDEVRRVLVDTGTKGVRETLGVRWGLEELLGSGLWVALADKRIRDALSHKRLEGYYASEQRTVRHWRDLLAFTDVRFPDEADLIRSHGGIVVRVVRPGLARPADEDISETALDDYDVDYTILNDGTPRGLELAVEAFTRELA